MFFFLKGMMSPSYILNNSKLLDAYFENQSYTLGKASQEFRIVGRLSDIPKKLS